MSGLVNGLQNRLQQFESATDLILNPDNAIVRIFFNFVCRVPLHQNMDIDKIVSVPPSLTPVFYEVAGVNEGEWFATNDPAGQKVGSGGGTSWAISQKAESEGISVDDYLSLFNTKRIIIHAGGQSRRLPAYASSGKVLTPIPVMKWSRGQRIDQNLLSLQMPLLERILRNASNSLKTLIVSGDVLIEADKLQANIPEADVVCFGLWTKPQLATNHGIFCIKRENESTLDYMLQKPSLCQLEELAASHFYLMDIGLWLLSDKALKLLMKKCGWSNSENRFLEGRPRPYDLYSEFGTALGVNPRSPDNELSALTVAIVQLDNGHFHHFGTSSELITSSVALQNRTCNQREIWHRKVKPQDSIFIQNAYTACSLTRENSNIWIENSYISEKWHLSDRHILTGIPKNNWTLSLQSGNCIDIVPIGDDEVAIRTYDIDDRFRGQLTDESTSFMGISLIQWITSRNLSLTDFSPNTSMDIQNAPLFPVVKLSDLTEEMVLFMLEPVPSYSAWWRNAVRLSADEISSKANMRRLFASRHAFLVAAMPSMEANRQSVFYQTDLRHIARLYAESNAEIPSLHSDNTDVLTKMRCSMFRSELARLKGEVAIAEKSEQEAFNTLQNTICKTIHNIPHPRCTTNEDQVVWASSPARLDLAGGWSDTPPNCMMSGGAVVTVAVNLNGQAPIQVFIRRTQSSTPRITIRSIDVGAFEEISTFSELEQYTTVGSAFCIPKAALCLAGFLQSEEFSTLEEMLHTLFDGGIEISTLVAIPKGSGLGTSSILAGTLLGALSDFCGLGWSKNDICHRVLVLEQMLTTGGGWQDQYGGIFEGVKLLESRPGSQEEIDIHWLPERIFEPQNGLNRWILYYTGITRVAKSILGEIVRGMFLGESERTMILNEIKNHAYDMAEAISRQDFQQTGSLLRRSWQQNKRLDSGTTTPEVEQICNLIDDYALGYKLLGAGGGGYMVICANDDEAASSIRRILTENPPNSRARIVEMSVSTSGFQIVRS